MTPPADELRDLLTAVAEGRVSPAEAAEQIGEPEATDSPAAEAGFGEGFPHLDDREEEATSAGHDDRPDDQAEPGAASTVERLNLDVAYRNLRVIGDAKVSGVTVEGPHERDVDGTTVRIEASDPPIGGDAAPFDENRGWRGWRNWRRFADDARLVVRVRPDLPIELHTMASSVAIVDYDGELHGECESSALRADVLKRPFDLSIRAGTIRLRAALTEGESRLHGDASAINVVIDPASDLQIALHGTMSSLHVPPELGGRRTGGPGPRGRRRKVLDERYDITTGTGSGLLTIDANMAAVRLQDGDHGSARGAATGRQRGGRPTSSHGAAARGPRGRRASDRTDR
jgi:hypothetical protein